MSVASAIRRGNPINQDECIVSEDEDKYKFIVVDGHGSNGEGDCVMFEEIQQIVMIPSIMEFNCKESSNSV